MVGVAVHVHSVDPDLMTVTALREALGLRGLRTQGNKKGAAPSLVCGPFCLSTCVLCVTESMLCSVQSWRRDCVKRSRANPKAKTRPLRLLPALLLRMVLLLLLPLLALALVLSPLLLLSGRLL
jgi:hypothetical protein